MRIFTEVQRDFPDYLHDESQKTGLADSLSFPERDSDIAEALLGASRAQETVTIQGARTGITGGAVPDGGHLLNLSPMKQILELQLESQPRMRVQAGISLAELRTFLQEETHGKWFFPPDPTETSASIGGMIACNASGARTLHYGPTRPYIRRLRIVLPDCSFVTLARDQEKSTGRHFHLTTESGRRIEGQVPNYRMPQVKSAAGYYVRPDMDLIDLFIGAEGTLGVVSEAELALLPSPANTFGALVFLPGPASAIRFVQAIKRQRPVAIEFFDSHALDLVAKDSTAGIPVPEGPRAAVYVEYHGEGDNFIDLKAISLSRILQESGGALESAILALDAEEMDRLKGFRHAVPEAVNRLIAERKKMAPGITKLGTDLAVPDSRLADAFSLYLTSLADAGLDYVIFGHIGNSHLHVNILPRSEEEYRAGRELYLDWARAVVRMGGTVSAEHGIGKLKREMLLEMYGPRGIEEMKELKRLFDPSGLLNRGNLFLL